MRQNSAIENALDRTSDLPRNGRRARRPISARHSLLSGSWTVQVEALEAVINGFQPDGHSNSCEVVFFEIAGDECLHVNVTHRYQRKVVSGWAGPGSIPDGFVHSRTFGVASHREMVRHIRDIVFAERV